MPLAGSCYDERMNADPLSWINDELQTLDAAHLRRRLTVRSSPQHPLRVVIDDRPLANFGANDYLGLAADPRIAGAAAEAAGEHGWGSGASPLVTGRSTVHAQLEAAVAKFEGTQAALTFVSGYAANVAAITSLAGRGDVIFSDARNHASIIDGCRLSGARVAVYRHNDVDHLRQLLDESCSLATECRRRLIATDSLFSMDGDFAPLTQLAQLARDYDAMLLIDEAHATGVWGGDGRGVASMMHVEDGVHIRTGTFSKALGSIGGFVAGSQSLVDWLANRGRSFVFSTAAPSAVAAANLQALELAGSETWRRERVQQLAGYVRTAVQQQGWDTGDSTSQIIPLIVGRPDRVMQLTAQLAAAGMLAPGIRPPSVPPGQSLLRLSLSAGHSDEIIAALLDELRKAKPG